jgi:hypothetical protein
LHSPIVFLASIVKNQFVVTSIHNGEQKEGIIGMVAFLWRDPDAAKRIVHLAKFGLGGPHSLEWRWNDAATRQAQHDQRQYAAGNPTDHGLNLSGMLDFS